MKKIPWFLLVILFISLETSAQRRSAPANMQQPPLTAQNQGKDTSLFDYTKSRFSLTTGNVSVEGKTIAYQAKTGMLVLKDNMGKPTVNMFYTAYFKTGEKAADRPITFLYNGGPGSATIWLHMGCFGPQKVTMGEDGKRLPPFKTENNDYSLLDASDLVFIDAPGTGFGEVVGPARGGVGKGSDFFGIDQDGKAFTDFIEQFITENNRWESPKYLFGESYGTFRSAVVSRLLQGRGIALNGVILLSQLLDYGNMTEGATGNAGNDLPYALVLPSMTATAWYHKKLPAQTADLESLLRAVEKFATTDYLLALAKGATLSEQEFHTIAKKLHDYTGLDQQLIEKANLRLTGPLLEKNLLGDSLEITGRLDSRFKGYDLYPTSSGTGYDPMDSHINSVFISTFNNYVRETLKFGDNLKYKTSGNVQPWDFKRKGFLGFPNVMQDLAQAIAYNPEMKVMLNSGYFDLATPYFEGQYEMEHLPMARQLQKNIEYKRYMSGHMVYLKKESLKELHDNVKDFIGRTH